MKPLHNKLQDILGGLPNDGTLDQNQSFTRCQAKAMASKCSYGFDLSAATDRLPLSLQKRILGSLVKDQEFAET